MATLIWIRTEVKPCITPFEREMESDDDLSLLRGFNVPRYLIAKGNVIEGIKAKW